MSRAVKAFRANIKRASFFLDIHEHLQKGPGPSNNPQRELSRGAVVFAIGALDCYISEVSAEVILARLKIETAPSDLRALLGLVQKEIPTLALEVALVPTHQGREDRLREAIADHLLSASNHGSKAVGAVIQRCKARPDDLWSVLASAGQPKAAETLDKWTTMRHDIVHRGKKERVRREHARDLLKLLEAIVTRIERASGL